MLCVFKTTWIPVETYFTMPSHSTAPLMLPGRCYHYYTRANTNENLFRSRRNFSYFLQRYRHFTNPVCRTFAYCMMWDHFHVLILVRSEASIGEFIKLKYPGKASSPTNLEHAIQHAANKEFANLLNSYAQAFNKYHGRRGRLFSATHQVREVKGRKDFLGMIAYIHNNPVKHGFTDRPANWDYNSYHVWSSLKRNSGSRSTLSANQTWLAIPALKPNEIDAALKEPR